MKTCPDIAEKFDDWDVKNLVKQNKYNWFK